MATKTLQVTHAAMIAVFSGLGLKTAKNWDVEACNSKLAKMLPIANDKDEIDPDVITDKAARKTFDAIAAAAKAKSTVEVIADEGDEAPAAPKSKKGVAALADDEPAEKPAKKSTKPAEKKTAKASTAKKDAHGYRVGSTASKLADALTGKAQTHAELVAAAEITGDGTHYEALGRLVTDGIAAVVTKDGKRCWKSA